MFSFDALLSTALSGSYSQSLIHRKTVDDCFSGTAKPLEQKKSARHQQVISEKERTDRHEWPVCGQRRDYLPMQKLENIRPNKSSELKAPVISPRNC
ncbi:hypothetical protein CES87_00625 [Pseudomonas sp. ERMR1:02]|nr:hypothetical protein CES87_00625 [Pseudomonas sp. ERMR1:02]